MSPRLIITFSLSYPSDSIDINGPAYTSPSVHMTFYEKKQAVVQALPAKQVLLSHYAAIFDINSGNAFSNIA